MLATTAWLKIGIQVAQNDRAANAHHQKQVSRRFEPHSPFYARFSVQKWPFMGCIRDDRPKNSGRAPVCQVRVCNEGHCSSTAIALSKDGKWVFNKACTMPWCHTVVHFEVKMSRLSAVFPHNRPDRGGRSLKQMALLQRGFPMCYARLGPSSVLVRVLITELGLPCRGFTPPFWVQG